MAGGGRSVLGRWLVVMLVVMATGTIALLGVAVPAAGLDSLPVSPVPVEPGPVTVGPVSVDPGVVVSPSGEVHAGVDTTTPDASDPSVSVDVGRGGATVSSPGGLGASVELPSPPISVPVSVPTNPLSPPTGSSAQSPGTAGAPSASSATILPTNRQQRGNEGVTAGQSMATNAAPTSSVLAPASIAGHVTTPGAHATPWAQIASAAVALAPWLVLLGLALFVRALMAAAGRRALTTP